mmetsp:Transcript_12506/g.41207  ORF Transcript_12506/g.41207 Transcript_12506/m.41207 type:complete len:202 (+) Transcript_12506:2893-3498(+)
MAIRPFREPARHLRLIREQHERLGVYTMVTEPPAPQLHAYYGEDEENERPQRKHVAELRQGGEQRLEKETHVLARRNRAQRAQQAHGAQSQQVAHPGDVLHPAKSHHRRVEHVPCVAEVPSQSKRQLLRRHLNREQDGENRLGVLRNHIQGVVVRLGRLPQRQRNAVQNHQTSHCILERLRLDASDPPCWHTPAASLINPR